jgi:hypothetical protein
MIAVSLASLLDWRSLFPADQAVNTVGTDTFSLIVVVPILLASIWLARRNSLAGMLIWPGALFFALYIYAFDVVSLPPGALFLPYVALVILSACGLAALVPCIDDEVVMQRLAVTVPARTAGIVLVALAVLFILIDVAALAAAITGGTPVGPTEHAAWLVDLVIECPPLLLGGFLLWRGSSPGYVAGTGLLLQIGMLLVAVPVGAALGAFLIGSPADLSSAMLILFGIFPVALLALFLRAATKVPVWRVSTS